MCGGEYVILKAFICCCNSFHFSGFSPSVRLWNLAVETAGQSSSLTLNWGNDMLNRASLNWEGLLQMVQPQTVIKNLDSTLMYVSSDTSGCVVQKVMMGCRDYKLQ